jgi:xanthine dehydrogenase accessory factor
MDDRLYALLADRLAAGQDGCLATLVAAHGSTPQQVGAKALFTPEGGILGTIGGGCLEHEARLRALDVLLDRVPALLEIRLNGDFDQGTGLICGGTAQVFLETPAASEAELFRAAAEARAAGHSAAFATVIDGEAAGSHGLAVEGEPPRGAEQAAAMAAEAMAARESGLQTAPLGAVYVELLLPRPRLWIVGAGHVGQATARLARAVDFAVHLVDDRPDLCCRAACPEADAWHVGDIAALLAARRFGPEDYVLVVTRGHRHDADAMAALLGRGAGYLGLIGSRRKIALIRDGLGADDAAWADVFAPVGLDLGAVSVEEIAVSIVAELIAVRHGRLTDPATRGWHTRAGGQGRCPASGEVRAPA